MTRRREWLLAAASLGLGGFGAADVHAAPAGNGYPQKPITLWVPWAAGGATDITLRLLAELVSVHLGQSVHVENRAGAGGTLAMPILQQAEPDGYTIAQIPQPVLRAPHTQKVLWDPVRDVTPIIQISGVTFGLLVGAASKLRSLDDVFAFARAHPGELSIATNGVGTTPHIVLEELFTARGLRYIHVPYKGTSELTLAVDTGQVMAGVNSTGFAPFVDSGRLRLLVTLAAKRSPRWPQVPTLKELGHNIVAMSPYGLGGPRGLPPAVVTVLHDAFKKAMHEPQFVQELAKYDQVLDYLGPVEYGQWLREQYVKERLMVERMGLSRVGS
ncbi:tripartite tricarboxylate transporter substrate binding protein [Aquabacterium sp.]|uniref:tripartite tricarboxylate transporter substrate binding protein n=1 Tax=Aquabacterium sp. TaxID=1872578 RepID=UPI002B57B44A|nr:tripartite tricarboxylate transporter substrate binding protein [Aquabacterium sp.]HSW06981.1 tripartite tricarboxylate transporter substrate binding protein [Aquabacterium sp.]